MKKLYCFLLCCLLILTLVACGGDPTDTAEGSQGLDTGASLTEVSIGELDSLGVGETARLEAIVTGKMGNKLYIAEGDEVAELVNVPTTLWLQCGVGQRTEFTVKATDNGITATRAKRISSGNAVPDPIPLTSLSSLNEQLYRKISIDGLTVVKIEGNVFDKDADVRITVSDGAKEAALLLSRELPTADREDIVEALNYPVAGDVLDILGAFVTKADGMVIEIGKADQIKPQNNGKINVERVEKNVADISLNVGESVTYTPKTYPENATNFAYLTYTVSDPSIAYIDENGALCGKAYGKTFLHIEQMGGSKVVIPVYVEPKLELGYDKWSPTKIDETPRVVTSFEELRAEFLKAAIGGYREIYIDFNLSEPIRAQDINRLFEFKYLANYPLHTVIGGDSVTSYKNEVVKFTFCGWEGETMYGPYEIPTEQSGVNFIDAASVLRQKYVISNSPYKRSATFENFPIVQKNSGTIPVYNPSQLVWALEYNLLPTFPLENSKAEYIYEQAKDILRSIITEDMTEIQKCKAIFDYICQNAVYAIDYYDRTVAVDYYPPEQSLIGFFERGRVVCEGYAETFSLLAGIEGIEVHRIAGDMQANSSGGHMWNAVVIDGKWYEICTTQSDHTMRGFPDNWFDEEAEGSGHDTHSYRHFLVDNKYFKEYYPYQTPSGAAYSTYYDPLLIDKLPNKEFDYIIESVAELEKVLTEVLALGLEGNYYICLSFRGIEPSFDMLDSIVKKYGFKGDYSYTTPMESLNGKDVFYVLTFHTTP